jgi:hypothetical protein
LLVAEVGVIEAVNVVSAYVEDELLVSVVVVALTTCNTEPVGKLAFPGTPLAKEALII